MPEDSFQCLHCHKVVPVSETMGTAHRNHCPFCLWSKHVDAETSGDRAANCGAGMEPIGLTFKLEGRDKYRGLKQGELMLIHRCERGDKLSINRIAADDDPQEILKVFEDSLNKAAELQKILLPAKIRLLGKEDEAEVKKQLFGIFQA